MNRKASRMVGGRKLTYTPSAPVPYSSRWYNKPSVQAVLRSRVEVKGVDALLTQASLLNTTNTNGGIQVMTLVAPGSGSFNRIGRKIQLKSLRLKGWITVPQGPSTTELQEGTNIRMIVVLDKQPSGSLPTFQDIFGYTDQAGTEASTMFAQVRYDNTERFVVLKDKTMDCNPQTSGTLAGTSSQFELSFDEFIPLKGITTVFSGQSATCTIADLSSNAVYVIWRSTNALGAVNTASVSRLRYVDI